MTGVLRGRWRKYDLNSAYLWASTLGMPKVKSFRMSRNPGRLPGMYNLELVQPVESLPYPFNVARFVNATTAEIDLYNLPIRRIINGVIWEDAHPEDCITRVVKQFTFAKQVSKSYWGRWCSQTPIECNTPSRTWELRNPLLNLVWAHFLISAVKRKVWQDGKNAAHVFVDSIITRDELPTGDAVGDWRHERTYEDGIKIRHAGYFGPRIGAPDKTTGEKKK